MGHPNAEKGKRWERECAALLGAKRCTRIGDHDDRGDLEVPDWLAECKDDQSHPLSRFIGQMIAARERTGKRWGVVLVKKRRAPARDGYAVMPIWLWDELRQYLSALEEVYCNANGGYPYEPLQRPARPSV